MLALAGICKIGTICGGVVALPSCFSLDDDGSGVIGNNSGEASSAFEWDSSWVRVWEGVLVVLSL